MNNFIVSCENDQELVDLTRLARKLNENNFRVCFFDLAPMLGITASTSIDFDFYCSIYKSLGCGRKFKSLSALPKLLIAILNAIKLIYIYYKSGARFVLIGTPLLVYRLARIITFGHLKTVSVIRGVVAHSEEATSLSSKLFIKFGRLARSKLFRSLFSDYYSSLVLCTGGVTRNFLLSRGVPVENIKVTGSIYCDSLAEGAGGKGGGTEKRLIVFISSAFAFHGYDDAQSAQSALIKKIRNFSDEIGVDFVVRKHPRESLSFYVEDAGLSGCLGNRDCDPLVGYPENTLFISTVSTLIFEMAYVGRSTCFIADDFFTIRFSSWYHAVGVTPVINWESVITEYSKIGFLRSGQELSGVLSVEFKGGVLDRCVREIFLKFGVSDAE
ncbi:hypothetical protein D3C77_180570 [compost metagenome]